MWLKVYMRITSKTRGPIEGECTQEGREKLIICHGMSHDVELPRDPASGFAAGAPIHHPFVVTTPIGAHTLRLIEACTAAEALDVDVLVYRINRMGEEEAYLTLKLTDATVVDNRIRFRETVLEENRACEHVEDVSFTYQKLTGRHELTKLEITQAWSGGGEKKIADSR
jgi:type VI secretion system secreted protein Hcp